MCTNNKTRNDGICEALQLYGRPTSRQSFWALVTRPIMYEGRSISSEKNT